MSKRTADHSQPYVQLATRIPRALHTRMKLHCVQTTTTVMAFVIAALEKTLGKASKK